ncbi:MAG: ABC transporter permease subunit [Parvibaculaceae bacterium]
MAGRLGQAGSGRLASLRRSLPAALPALAVAVFFGGLFLYPLARIAIGSVSGLAFDLGSYAHLVYEPLYFDVILRTFKLSGGITLACVMLGYPLAYALTIARRRTAIVLGIALLVPLFTAFLIRSYAWIILLGRAGVLNKTLLYLGVIDQPLSLLHNRTGVYVGMVHSLMPIAVFTMHAVMAQIDRNLGAAAAIMGADPVRSFTRVFLPLSMPGVIAAAILVFITSMGFYVVPSLLGGPQDTMIAQLIVTQVSDLFNFQLGYALSMTVLAAMALLLYVANFFIPLDLLWSQGIGPDNRSRRRWAGSAPLRRTSRMAETVLVLLLGRAPHLRKLLLWTYVAAGIVFLVLPLLVVIVLSFSSSPFLVFPPPGFSTRWYADFFTSPAWRNAVLFSFEIGILSSLLAVAVGICGAFLVVRRKFRGQRAAFLIMLAPLVTPTIVLALGLYREMIDLDLLGTVTGMVLGHALIGAPYAVVIMVSAFRSFDWNLSNAAAILGARPLAVLRRVTLPILRPAVLTAGLLAFLASFDELIIALFLLGRQPPTLPIKMWNDIRMQINPVISSASSIIIVAIVAAVLAGQWLRIRAERRRSAEPEAAT